MLDIAYVIPITVNCMRGRNMLPERAFVLPNTVGWIANIVCYLSHGNFRVQVLTTIQISMCYIYLTTVLFLFPPELPVSGSNMSTLPLFSFRPKAETANSRNRLLRRSLRHRPRHLHIPVVR